jgi:hypothetical protein
VAAAPGSTSASALRPGGGARVLGGAAATGARAKTRVAAAAAKEPAPIEDRGAS